MRAAVASAELSACRTRLTDCHLVTVRVTFDPTGEVRGFLVEPEELGPEMNRCIQERLAPLRVPSFSGLPVVVRTAPRASR